MNKRDNYLMTSGFWLGVGVSIIIGSNIYFTFTSSDSKNLKECKLKLTREQHCVKIYIPETELEQVKQIISE